VAIGKIKFLVVKGPKCPANNQGIQVKQFSSPNNGELFDPDLTPPAAMRAENQFCAGEDFWSKNGHFSPPPRAKNRFITGSRRKRTILLGFRHFKVSRCYSTNKMEFPFHKRKDIAFHYQP